MNNIIDMPVRSGPLQGHLRITDRPGLTLRMAGEIVRALQPLDVDIALEHGGVVANARSVLSIVCLAAPFGARVSVWANGADAPLAVEIIAKAFRGGRIIREAAH